MSHNSEHFAPSCEALRGSRGNFTAYLRTMAQDARDVGENAWACQNACFTEDGNGDPQGSAIVAYYTKDFKEGGFEKKAGEAATFNDPKWEVNTESGFIKFVGSPADCTDSGNLLATPEVRSSFAVDANGDALPSGFDPADMNQFESGGSLYSPGCKAVSYRNPFDSRCEATEDIKPTRHVWL